jgi:hypothetical protein
MLVQYSTEQYSNITIVINHVLLSNFDHQHYCSTVCRMLNESTVI